MDAFGQTSAPDVYALGDCAEYRIAPDSTQILPYIAPMMTAARAIARTLNGDPTPIEIKPAPVIVKTPCYPLALVPPPMPADRTGQWHAEVENGRTVCRFYDAQGLLAGFGVAPQEAAVRQLLLAGLGLARQEIPLAQLE